MELLFIIELVSAVICIIVGISTYKALMQGRASVREGWSAIEVQLQRRINLIPNLVETARGYAGHEQQTLENVTNALTMLQNAPGPSGAAQADDMLASALQALFAVADANPNLQADRNYRNLQHHLADTEDKIAYARDFYNARAMGFNSKVNAFPGKAVARAARIKEAELFDALYTVSGRRISELAETQQAAIAAPEAESEHESHSHYSRDMHDAEWERVYERQLSRADMVEQWLDGLRLREGSSVLDIGSGPGYVSLQAAKRVGPTGMVYAVDRSEDALAYLARLQEDAGVTNIQRRTGDAATCDLQDAAVDGALITLVLHHNDEPQRVLDNVSGALRQGALVVIGEFDKEGPGDVGAAIEERLALADLRQWCAASHLKELSFNRVSPDHYFLVLERE